MADYNANIKVNADTRQAESQLKKLQSSLDKLSNFSSKINLQNAQREFNKLGTTLRGIGERGALGALTLGAGKATAAIGGLGAKFGIVGAAAASAGTAINTALGGVPGVVTDILSQVGSIPNAFGLAAVAAMAFAPQVLKASAATVGLGAAIDKAVGKETTEKIADIVGNVGLLKTEINTVKTSFASLIQDSTLNQLNAQLRDAVEQTGAFHSSTTEAVTAAQQLVTVTKAQAAEQRAINDLVRQAKGITQTELEESKAVKSLQTKRNREKYYEELAEGIEASLRAAADLDEELVKLDQHLADLDTAAAERRWQALETQWREADEAGAALSARMDEIRRKEAAASAAARGGPLRPFDTGGVVRRTIAGPAYDRPAGPAGEPFAAERASARQAEAAVRELLDKQIRTAKAAESWGAALRIGTRWLQEGLELNGSMLTITNNILSATYAQEAARERMSKAKAFELAQEKQIAAVRKRTESISLGVGFPLLFGGGVGSVAGSFAGSFLGESGFGGQILLGAIGQKVEEFVRAAAAVTESTETISETLKLAGTSSEAYIQALERAGRESEAYTYALDRLALVVGSDGVKAFKELQEAGETFNRAFAEITTSILALAARLLAGAAQGIAGAVEETALFRRAAVSEDPQTKQLIAQLQSPATGFQSFLTGGRAYDDLLKQIIERQRELEAEQQKSAASVTSVVNTHREDLAVLTKRLELTRLNGEITDASVIAATKELYVLERQAEQQKLYNDYATDAITIDVLRAGIKKSQLDYETKLAELVNDVSKARTTGADKAQKAAEAASDLTQKLQRQLELATAKTDQDKEALRILFEYEDNVEAIRKLEDQSQAARQNKIADELYSLELNRLATDELTKYLNTLISIAAVSPGLGRQAFRGNALQGVLQTDVGLAFGTQANLAEATPEDIQLQKAKDRLEELIAPINQVETAAEGIGSAFTDSFKSVIDGTATTQEALANMFNRIADAFFDMAAQIITQMLVIKAVESAINIFGGGGSFKGFSGAGPAAFPSDLNIGVAGFMAKGGPVSAGSPYVVGERGPELFVPGRSGTIVPNSQLGGDNVNVVVNVDAKGTSVQGNDQTGNQLGRVISAAVQQELIKQKRPGGLLA